MIKVLIVDDEAHIRFILSEILEKAGYETIQAENGFESLEKMKNLQPEIVLLDYKLPDIDGIKVLEKLKEINGAVIVIMITAFKDVKKAVAAMKLGAYDYLTKPFNNDEIILVVQKALQNMQLNQEVKKLRHKLDHEIEIKEEMGESAQLKKVLEQVDLVADNNITVFLQGETGSGKELIAKMIHKRSSRRNNPFIALDCGAIPETLFESELFGYEKGAFTGANSRRIGKFEQANNGTLFLDEISNLPLNLQPKLLRVIQESKIQRLGGNKIINVDVRIIAASNKDIVNDVKEGKLRTDLFYRIHEFKIILPTLKERKDDIPILANYFLKVANEQFRKNIEGFSIEAMDNLINYDWPGNIRELKNVINRSVIIAKSKCIESEHLLFTNLGIENQKFVSQEYSSFDKVDNEAGKIKIEMVKDAIKKAGGNKTEAAKLLDITRNRLYRILNGE